MWRCAKDDKGIVIDETVAESIILNMDDNRIIVFCLAELIISESSKKLLCVD